MIPNYADSPEPQSGIYQDARRGIRLALGQAEAMRRALEQSMDAPGGMGWEEEIGGPIPLKEPEPTSETTPRMEEPHPKSLSGRRLALLRKQMDAHWPDKKQGPFKRKPWHSK